LTWMSTMTAMLQYVLMTHSAAPTA
jgi:hypothetical protein